ncbi:SDR family NAD(P)-dependent oxidoreductase [Trueperella sp.]|uniref:SDR family NAD(P)-dependent oxidoreductase n=1 Tax=Trueperella sp. TaxID=2699835 RepID=UPI0037361112
MAETSLKLQGRALITGGTSGLGLTFARALARRGTDIVLVARNLERLEKTRMELQARGVECDILQADLSEEAGVAAVKERLLDDSSPITVFVNNAGAGLYTRLAVTDASELRFGAEVMGLAPMELGGAMAYKMKERGRGTIITTASVASLVPMGAYSAIKGMIKIWSDSLAIELAGSGVQVTSFLPGWVRTEFHQRSGVSTSSIPDFLWLDAERVVGECLTDVERGKTISIPSKRFKVLAFLAEHAPKPIVAKVVKKLNKGRR